jgi:Bacterial regulatory helix-turn-helix protein, lysR family
MKQFVQLTKIWSWLPHFRVVAEFENLGKAARQMNVTTAALSKAIKQLEAVIGHALFDRVDGKLRLNVAGRELHEALRGAMRDIDNAVTAPAPRAAQVVAVDPIWAMVLGIEAGHVELRELGSAPRDALARGELDIVIVDDATAKSDHAVIAIELLRTPWAWVQKLKNAPAKKSAVTTLGHGFAMAVTGSCVALPVCLAQQQGWAVVGPHSRQSQLVAFIRAPRPNGRSDHKEWVQALAARQPAL